MGEIPLTVEIRKETGKGVARRLRAAGRIPAVVYGSELASVAISLDPRELDRLIHTSHAGVNTLIDLTGPQEVSGRTVLVKDLQREPVRGDLVHADLFEVDPDERIRVSVPIHLTGTAPGVTMGGLLDHALRVLELDCLPRAIPDEILVDVSALDIGDSIHVAELNLPAGVELHTQADTAVVSVGAPRLEEEAAAEPTLGEGVAAPAEAEPGEPEGEDKES